ncbi:MAG: terpene cyclase/mutase family protein [Planctomycetes bacterium]|nr:terpene cyclase/mutase family protein [Planctomycetota bacterium]
MIRISNRWKLAILLLIAGAMLFDRPHADVSADELAARRAAPFAGVSVARPLPSLRRRGSPKPWSFQETTKASKAAIRNGNKFLLKTINRDGGCGVDVGVDQPSDVGVSSIVGLSLMVQGNTLLEGPRSRELRRISEYIIKQVRKMSGTSDVSRQTNTQLQRKIGYYAHSFFAALFLSQVVGEDANNRDARQALVKLVNTISKAQQSDGSWGRGSWAPTLGTVMGWVSLRGSYSAGFKVKAAADKTAKHLVSQMNSQRNSGSWMHTLYKQATGIRVLYSLGKKDDPVTKKAVENVLTLITRDNRAFAQAGGEEFLAFHLITDTMLQSGGKDWKRWYPLVRDRIVKVQNADGSWTGHHCITSRTFCTAAALLVLSAPNRMMPISQE